MVNKSYMVNGQMVHDSTFEYHRDSTIISYRPSVRTEVLQPATCNLPPKVDTMVIEHWRDRWRDHEVVKTDTLKVTEYQTITETQKYIPRFYRICTWICCIGIVLLVVFLVLKFTIKI